MRKLRFIPPGGALVEVTTRTQQGRFLLRPSQKFNQIAVGVLARALKQAEVRFHGMVFLSNHAHALLSVPDAQQLAKFMNYLNGQLARRIADLQDWPDKIWSRRYQAIVISNEPEAHEARLRYILEQGAKENLVISPLDWPGIHLAKNIVDGEPLSGYWIDGSKVSAARAAAKRSGEEASSVNPMDFATYYEVPVEPLPEWSHRPYEEYRSFVAALVHQIEEENFKRRLEDSSPVLGRRKICKADPHHRPERVKNSPAPAFHAVAFKALKALCDAYAWFVEAYRDAADKLKKGHFDAQYFRRAAFHQRCRLCLDRPSASIHSRHGSILMIVFQR